MSKFIPKAGEECVCTHNNFNCKVTPDFVGKELVVFTYEGDEVPLSIECFKPIKTPAEIEREELTLVINNTGRTNHSTDIADAVINAGYRKQQVKPLSRSYATGALHITNMAYDDLARLGFILQGGDE